MAEDNPLAFFTHEQLVNELRSRCSEFVCIGRPLSPQGEGFDWFSNYGGNFERVLGLIEVAKFSFLRAGLPDDEQTTEWGEGT